MRSRICAFAIAMLYVAATSAPERTSAAPPAIYNLGTLGGMGSNSHTVNDAGQVAGESWIPGNTVAHAFRYDGTPGAGGVMAFATLGCVRRTIAGRIAKEGTDSRIPKLIDT